ncbi:hypothetical protein D9X30_1695 (plasmid) [Cupriavidus sp. U2]|uniref:GNAT family N-acetyltransferase n=1 Tax=Cupriavidus sp. U2 TaxID=2920269 RepID=UPI00129D3208|nr:GNAT family N-acetyltransferase [Cupriavidus sp. U2]KAI3593385.1 hypothetical protein D9X30_1695 [Cupriavidus sp. U2]
MPDLEMPMKSFEAALKSREIAVQPGALDEKIFVHMDKPAGEPRFSYVRLDRTTVTAFVVFIPADPYERLPCFQVGWAVPKELRGQGRAADAFRAAVNELWNGMSRNGMREFYVEAVVEQGNVASEKLAEKVVSSAVKTGIDKNAGVPITQYFRKIDGIVA